MISQEHRRFAEAASLLAGQAAVMFGWRPGEFWAATPAELAGAVAALAGGEGFAAAGAEDIARLMEEFPDG